jgi:hypothetical protein
MFFNIATIGLTRLKRFGILYTAGWLIGSFIFKDLLSPLGYFLNIATPIVILIIRVALWIKKAKIN